MFGTLKGLKQLTLSFLFLSGALLWFVVSELFFGFSANRVYAHALKKVKASAEVNLSGREGVFCATVKIEGKWVFCANVKIQFMYYAIMHCTSATRHLIV